MDLSYFFYPLVVSLLGAMVSVGAWVNFGIDNSEIAKSKSSLDYPKMQKAIEMVKDGHINEAQVDYTSMRVLIKRLPPAIDASGVIFYQHILDVLKKEEKVFKHPRIEVVRGVLNWIEGQALLAQMNVTHEDKADNTLLYREWWNGAVKLKTERETIAKESAAAIKQHEQKIREVQVERDVLASRKNFTMNAITSGEDA